MARILHSMYFWPADFRWKEAPQRFFFSCQMETTSSNIKKLPEWVKLSYSPVTLEKKICPFWNEFCPSSMAGKHVQEMAISHPSLKRCVTMNFESTGIAVLIRVIMSHFTWPFDFWVIFAKTFWNSGLLVSSVSLIVFISSSCKWKPKEYKNIKWAVR